MKKLFARVAIQAFLAMALLPATHAATNAAYCSKPVRVAMFEFGVLYRADTSDGMDVRILAELERHSGCTFERVYMPRSRIWKELQMGRLDMATSAIPTSERKVYGYLLPYFKARNVVLMRRQSAPVDVNQTTFENGKLRLGVVRGFRHEADYDTMVAKLSAHGRVVEAVDVVDLFRLLDRKVVDAILSQPIVYTQYLAASRLDEDLTLHDWAPADQFSVGALILARASFTTAQAKHWDELLVDMQNDGTLYKIAREFLPAKQARDFIYTGPRSPE
ncbi:substrate-binding periplasmic protein [Candidatus Aalborgicola defluviihabitans]|uniref:substrate-binding periplasmic protein n=1 Tax=Candidatus Aalborgicola defluviihabitans TaxID=3386187 RepID=UPI001DE03EB0|nr:transporter substrate-binding domain-containing protein [Burkholderiales bacterium]